MNEITTSAIWKLFISFTWNINFHFTVPIQVKIKMHDLSISKAFQTQTRKSGQGQFFLVTPVN